MKLLFICTHNRCRSILCEAIANQRGEGFLQAASAGSAPVASVYPLTLLYLEERGYNVTGLKSQSWNDLQAFEYAAIQEYPYSDNESCDSEDETFKSVVIRNSSNYDLEAVYLAYLGDDGSLISDTDFESLEFVVAPGSIGGRGFCSAEDDHPVGATIKEAYYVYKNPETGKLIEGTHVFFDNQYSGDYAIVRAAAGSGGSVVGNPSSHTRVNADTEITFQPNYGYKLSNVSGTCPGSVHYNVYTAEPVYGDCWAVASFRPLGPAELIEQQFNDLLQTVMSFRGN